MRCLLDGDMWREHIYIKNKAKKVKHANGQLNNAQN